MRKHLLEARHFSDELFTRYSLSDDSIDTFLNKINCIDGISINRIGEIIELSQQDYHGKRVFVVISDDSGNSIESKIDFGVHNRMEITQEEYCFDISFDDEGASLLINSREQMVAEKIRSLLKFGVFSTRYKDVFDIYYHCDKLDIEKFIVCMDSFVFSDPEMRENNMIDVQRRLTAIFQNQSYRSSVNKSDKRWLDDDINVIFDSILKFIASAQNF